MKKIFALASMMMVLSVSAQQQKMDRPASHKISIHEQEFKDQRFVSDHVQLRDFEKYDLTLSQKQKLKVALDRYEKEIKYAKKNGKGYYENQQKDLDKKIEKILSKQQFAQYKRDLYHHQEVAFYKQPMIKNHR